MKSWLVATLLALLAAAHSLPISENGQKVSFLKTFYHQFVAMGCIGCIFI